MVTAAKEVAKNLEVKVFAKVEAKGSQGDRVVIGQNKGLIVDSNHGSNTGRRYTGEASFPGGIKGEIFSGTKDKVETTRGGSLGGPIGTILDVPIVGNVSHNTTTVTENGEVTKETTESSSSVTTTSGIGLHLINSREVTEESTTDSFTVSPATGGFSFGIGETYDYTFSVGATIGYKKDHE